MRTLPLAAAFLLTAPAHAVEPLADFLLAARAQSFDAREQTATLGQRGWEKDAALGRLLPSLTARGILQYNQYEIVANFNGNQLVISPQVQTDGIFQLDVPIVDLANYHRYGQAKHLEAAAAAQKELVGTDLDRAVSRAYFTYVGASALAASADRAVALAVENEDFVKSRVALGVGTELDLARASANVERARQDRADAELGRSIAARTLQTLSGRTPSEVTAYPVDDLSPEKPLAEWLAAKDTPTDKLQKELYEASVSAKKAASSALLPTLSANAQERLTNATGFIGQVSTYTLQAVLSWRLDYATYAQAQAQAAAADIQQIRAERSRRGLEDSLYEAHQRVEAGITKCASARAQVKAADRAAELALIRYQAGALTQLEVTQSQKEAFQAQAAKIQADADLLFARALLRILSGLPPEAPTSDVPLVTPTAADAAAPAATEAALAPTNEASPKSAAP